MMELEDLVSKNNWVAVVKESFPVAVADQYSYEEAMQIAAHIFLGIDAVDGDTDYRMCDFTITLLYILRAKYPEKWREDWQNEAFLGVICWLFVHRIDEGFQFLQNTFNSMEDPPASLILAYIHAGSCPPYLLAIDKIEELSKRAVEKELTVQTAQRMYGLTDDPEWKKKAEEAEKAGLYTENIVPEVMRPVVEKLKR